MFFRTGSMVPLPFLEGGLLVILIAWMILLSSFLDVTRMSMSTVSFLIKLDSGILPIECFPLTYNLNGFKSRINCSFFVKRFPTCFNFFVLLFLVTPCLLLAVQPYME